MQGCHGHGEKSGENNNFSRSEKSQGILLKVRENLRSCQSREFYFRCEQNPVKSIKRSKTKRNNVKVDVFFFTSYLPNARSVKTQGILLVSDEWQS